MLYERAKNINGLAKSGHLPYLTRKKMTLTRKCHDRTLQSNPWHREEETQEANSKIHKTRANSFLFLGVFAVYGYK